MGLDMFMMAERELTARENRAIGLNEDTYNTVRFEVAYWRKANQIHKWFVDTVQYGNDDCGNYYVPRENLLMLKSVCESVLTAPRERNQDGFLLAEEVLPTESGFFFGPTEYGEYYYEQLEDTIEQLERILNDDQYEDCRFYYHSSW